MMMEPMAFNNSPDKRNVESKGDSVELSGSNLEYGQIKTLANKDCLHYFQQQFKDFSFYWSKKA